MEKDNTEAAKTHELVRMLIQQNFSARDNMYAAAGTLTDEELRHVCQRLADELGGNVADLQQLLIAKGESPAVEPRDHVGEKLKEITMEMLHRRWGADAVLGHAIATEQRLKDSYDLAIDSLPRPSDDVGEAFRNQREGVEFSESVLDKMQSRRKKQAHPAERPRVNENRKGAASS